MKHACKSTNNMRTIWITNHNKGSILSFFINKYHFKVLKLRYGTRIRVSKLDRKPRNFFAIEQNRKVTRDFKLADSIRIY